MTAIALLCIGLVVADENAGAANEPPVDVVAYRAAATQAGRDAAAHVRLALWCEAHGMTAERMKHLAAAVLNDPANALARGLLGMIAVDGKWERPDDASREAKDDQRRRALMQEYLDRRAKAADKADDQWKLALWCEENGLKPQAVAHYHAVLRLDPRREATWKRLGFKKIGGRWIKPESQAAAKREADEQERANKHWRPILERLRSGTSGRDRQRRAVDEAELAQVTDPRAVPMVWAVFVPRGAEGQKVAVRVLGQIDAPGSSRALALLALSGKSDEARGEAMQILRRRDPRDFAPLLVAMIRDPIKYRVKPVGGPGKPGELVIQEGTTTRERLYSPPPAPQITPGPNDYVSLDASGLPVITRYLGFYQTGMDMHTNSDSVALSEAGSSSPFGLVGPSAAQVTASLEKIGVSPSLSQKMGSTLGNRPSGPPVIPGNPRAEIFANFLLSEQLRIPIGEMMLESQVAAQVAGSQLAGDVGSIEASNAAIRKANRQVRQVLFETVGKDLGDDHSAWSRWLVDLFGYAYLPQLGSAQQTTIVEQVPLAYQPQTTPIINDQPVAVQLYHHSCFGAGTPIRTLDGLRPIETLRPGDLVLSQASDDGTLSYQAVVAVYHNPPNATYRIALETGEAIVATGIHRLWKAGKGWTMARELKPGDVLRTLGGVAVVKAVEADRTQPVFNLRVADGESYFVGNAGVLAHDNSTINPVPEPFDAVAPLSAGTTTRKSRSMLGR